MIYLNTFLFSDESVNNPNIYPYNVFADKTEKLLLFSPITVLYGNNASVQICYVSFQRKHIMTKDLRSFFGAEKALVKLAKCVGANGFEQTAVFIDPKARQDAEKDAQIEAFCEAL